MAQSLQAGRIYQYTTSGLVTAGQLAVINKMAGVILSSNSATGDKVSIALEGVARLTAVATGAKTAGALAYYRSTGSQLKVAATATGSVGATGATGSRKATCIGTIWETATATATSVLVKLLGGPLRKL
jgi:predicted RecA/RadA family phage recombinase